MSAAMVHPCGVQAAISQTGVCRFKNLCYLPEQRNFVFFHSVNSTMVGVPRDRFNPALLDLSSVQNHNTQYFNFVDVPSHLSEKLLLGVKLVSKTSLIFNRFHLDNIMHVMHDDLLPLYTTLCMINGGPPQFNVPFDIQLMFADNYEEGNFIALYGLFSAHIPLLRRKMDEMPTTPVCFADVHVGLLKHSTWYQYGFYEPQGPIPQATVTAHDIKHFTQYLTHRISRSHSNHQSESNDLVVLITRKDTRLILNEIDLCLILATHLDKKVLSISLETHSTAEIVNAISRAMLLVGMHGSLMIFAMFLPPGAIILELFPYGVDPERYTPYKTLANIHRLDLIYRSWRNTDRSKTVTHPDRPQDLGGIHHLSAEQQAIIGDSVEVTQHLCCSDPAWLFRIYQDTVIDLDVNFKHNTIWY